MSAELLFTSVEDGSTLSLRHGGSDSLLATATGPGFSVTAPVYTYLMPPIPHFLESLAAPLSADRHELSWGTLEGELRMVATRDSVGHIFLRYELRSPDIGSNRWWTFTGRLVLELGALPNYCRRAKEFCSGAT